MSNEYEKYGTKMYRWWKLLEKMPAMQLRFYYKWKKCCLRAEARIVARKQRPNKKQLDAYVYDYYYAYDYDYDYDYGA